MTGIIGRSHKALGTAMKAGLALFYPPQCLSCGMAVAGEGALCPDCWRDCQFLSGTGCASCAVPLPQGGAADPAGGELCCDDCLQIARPWDRAAAALAYRGTGRRLVLALKHGDRLDLAPSLGAWLAAAARPLILPDMIVVPVPIHPRRLLRRKFNQAALLAAAAARAHGLPTAGHALRRVVHRPMMERASPSQRFQALEDAIRPVPAAAGLLASRPVLLVDDVMTSGATLAAATDALLSMGAGPVRVAVLARALKE